MSSFPPQTATDRSRDTGLALVLLLLLAEIALGRQWLVTAAAIVLAVTMTAPIVFRPLAIVWFGLSAVLGAVMSRVILTVVFALVVVPVAAVLRLLGKDPMRLRQFKRERGSVLVVRNHTVSAHDLANPY